MKIIDIPEEEPEEYLEPWRVYMTDPVVKRAVYRYLSDNELLPADLPEAAARVAQTVAPAPHNAAAHDARYLLAPEAAERDEELLRSDPGLRGRVAVGPQADPEDLAGWPYAEPVGDHLRSDTGLGRDLLNRREDVLPIEDYVEGGPVVVVTDQMGGLLGMDSGPQNSGTFFAALMAMLNEGTRGSRRPWVVPPVAEEGREPAEVAASFTWSGEIADEETQNIWREAMFGMESYLIGTDRIPIGPPQVEVRDHVAVINVKCVPAQGRTFFIGVTFDETVEQLQAAAQARPDCRLLECREHAGFLTAVMWDKHDHHGYFARARVTSVDPQETGCSEGAG